MGPPPRPPRRIRVPDMVVPISPPPPSSTHTVSHSLSSLQMFSPPAHRISLEEQQTGPAGSGAGVSRTQSLRAQAKHADNSGLGRSSSLRTPGEVRPSLQIRTQGFCCLLIVMIAGTSKCQRDFTICISVYSPDTPTRLVHRFTPAFSSRSRWCERSTTTSITQSRLRPCST